MASEEDDADLLHAGHSSNHHENYENSFLRILNRERLLISTIVGVVLGVVVGCVARLAYPSSDAKLIIGFVGEILLRGLKLMVLPLMCGSMIAGVCSLSSSGGSKMKKTAQVTISFYAVTSLSAAFLAVVLVNVIRPGVGNSMIGSCPDAVKPSATTAISSSSSLGAFIEIAKGMVPPNIVEAAASNNILGIITFSLFFGGILATMGERAKPMVELVHIFNDVIMKMVNMLLLLTPFGVMSLIAGKIVEACSPLDTVKAMGWYICAVLVGLGIHGFIILPLMYFVLTRKNPYVFIRGSVLALLTAFGTDSSAATIPVTLKCCQDINGLHPDISRFVVCLGSTVNMNGTALYEALTVIFIAQSHGVALGIGTTIVIALTGTIAAVGAAAIPSAGLVTMVMVLQASGLAAYSADIALILAIDWFLDRCRTCINVLGDAVAAGVVDAYCRRGIEAEEAKEVDDL